MDIIPFMEQMGGNEIAIVAAFFIGLMTAISPCPLATNITAVAYISRKIEDSKRTLLTGACYTLGRMFTYTALASLIVYFGLEMQGVARLLQSNSELLLGPLLLIVGLVMLEILRIPEINFGGTRLERFKEKLSNQGYAGAFALGSLFALAFCPFSAVLFFGMLIPLAIKSSDAIFIPISFSIATGLPVLIAAYLLTRGANAVGKFANRARLVEAAMRKLAGIIFILVGTYYSGQLLT